MNLKKVIGMSLVGLSAAFAQEAAPAAPAAPAAEPAVEPAAPQEVAPEAAAPTQETAPEVAPAAQPASETAAPAVENAEQVAESAPEVPANRAFDVLHGSSYNTVGNEAAGIGIDLLLGSRPDMFANRKFFYIEPSAERGVVSFGNVFGAVDISGDLGRLTAGYATNGFGVALRASLGQFYVNSDNGEKYNTEAGDDLGLSVSKILGGYALTFQVDWNTYADEEGLDPKYGSSSDENYRDLDVTVGFSNGPSAGKVAWTASLNFLRHENNTEVAGNVIDANADSYVKIAPAFNVGFMGLQSEHGRVFVGANSSVPVVLFDSYKYNAKGKKVDENLMEVGLAISPNIVGEVMLGNHVMVYGEASYDWLAFGYGNGTDENGDDYSVLQSQMNKVNATVGLRYQYEDFVACEFAFGDSFFTDTKSIFNGQGVFVSFGGFINF